MQDTIEITLQERLLVTRHRAKMSRRTMARLLDVGPGTIGNWEHGRVQPDYRSMVAWCFALGIELSDLGIEKIVCSSSPETDQIDEVA